jgi:GntR family transcriptional regulator/MocR family aminotransferase
VAIDLFRSLGVRLYGVPVDKDGMQVERVEDALRTVRPRLIFTVPTFHNPTGTCLTSERRRKLVTLADRYSVPILEDDYGGNLRFEGRAQPALKALDPGGCVIYAGTFSKVLMPGLRLGFLVASGPVFDRLLAAKYVSDLATSEILQRALHEYLTVGRYHAYLKRTIQTLRRQRDAMAGALRRHLPADARWFVPQGGRYLWLQLPESLQAGELFALAAEEGVTFIPGSFFFPGKRPQSHLRLNFAINPPEAIEEGVGRLGQALERLMARKRRTIVAEVREGGDTKETTS